MNISIIIFFGVSILVFGGILFVVRLLKTETAGEDLAVEKLEPHQVKADWLAQKNSSHPPNSYNQPHQPKFTTAGTQLSDSDRQKLLERIGGKSLNKTPSPSQNVAAQPEEEPKQKKGFLSKLKLSRKDDDDTIPQATSFPMLKDYLKNDENKKTEESLKKRLDGGSEQKSRPTETGTSSLTTQPGKNKPSNQSLEDSITSELNKNPGDAGTKIAKFEELLREKNEKIEELKNLFENEKKNRNDAEKVKELLEQEIQKLRKELKESKSNSSSKSKTEMPANNDNENQSNESELSPEPKAQFNLSPSSEKEPEENSQGEFPHDSRKEKESDSPGIKTASSFSLEPAEGGSRQDPDYLPQENVSPEKNSEEKKVYPEENENHSVSMIDLSKPLEKEKNNEDLNKSPLENPESPEKKSDKTPENSGTEEDKGE